jgi:tRNA(Leu) C34 or U34 (ribose-2'-O)-methylase TrmL
MPALGESAAPDLDKDGRWFGHDGLAEWRAANLPLAATTGKVRWGGRSRQNLRGYFGIGVEGISKPMNLGSLMRTAHAFGASFVFTIGAAYARDEGRRSDTSDASGSVPLYEFPDLAALRLPTRCKLVGVELLDEAVDLPSFRHPRECAYVLGPERGSLSPALTAKCDHVVKIPTKFCVNVGLAGALVMYDRVLSLGGYPPRPLQPGGPAPELSRHVFGRPRLRSRASKAR